MVLRFQSSPSLSPYGKSLESSSVVVVVLLGLFSQLQCTVLSTLGQKPTFYPEITKILMFEKCEFCETEKRGFEIVNFVKNEALKM